MLYKNDGCVVSPCVFLWLRQIEPKMLKKAILLSTMLALAIGQALAVNCDLSCGLTGGPSANGTCGVHARISSERQTAKHCHEGGRQTENQSVVALSGHSCGFTFCKSGLLTIRSAATIGTLPGPDLALSVTSFVNSFVTNSLSSAPHLLLVSGRAGRIPLDVRPGSPLRI